MAKKTTPKPIIKSLSFKYKNYDCYEHIKDMPNFSDYICDLIRLDMEYDLLRSRPRLMPRPVTSEPKAHETKEKSNSFVTEKANIKIEIPNTEDISDNTLDFDEYENF